VEENDNKKEKKQELFLFNDFTVQFNY